jgi:hypothetical protein
MNFRKKIKIYGTIAVLILIFIYALFNARQLLSGPQIIIKSPENGLSFDTPFIEIIGEAKNTSFIKMNGQTIYVNENDEFTEKLLLPPGTSIIKIDARDRFERSTEVTLWYTYTGEVTEIEVPEISTTTASSSTTSTSSSSLE